ncbi:Probable LRR receptor-like serine/threonine-protein kinase At5g48740, partial [Linum perenne]
MALYCCLRGSLIFLSFGLVFSITLSNPDGFLSLSCGGMTDYVDPASSISWTSDTNFIGSKGNTTSVVVVNESTTIPLRFFPNSVGARPRNCYSIPLPNRTSSFLLVRAKFVYRNYDGLGNPPAFYVSLATVITSTVNLTSADPWIEEFVWPVNDAFRKDVVTISFCLIPIPGAGDPVISSIELRPIPVGAYRGGGFGDLPNKSLRKSYRINTGYTNGSIRYPVDPYDRIWDTDDKYNPFHASSGLNVQLSLNTSTIAENPPISVLQTARVMARSDVLTYNLPLGVLGDYYILLYFAGILDVSPAFDVLINGDIVQLDYTVQVGEATALYLTRKAINNLNLTLRSTKFYPQINGIEVYQIVDIPLEASSTIVSALEVIQQATGLDLGWEDDPCSPTQWLHVGCEGSLVTSLELSDVNLRSITPTFGDLLDLKTLDLHNTSLEGEINYLGSLQRLEKLNLSFNQLMSFGGELYKLVSLQVLDLQNNSLEGVVPQSLGAMENLHLLNLENNKLQGTLPESLNRENLEVRASGNLCVSFFTATCNEASSDPSIETPQVTILVNKKAENENHVAIILGAAGGALLALIVISIALLLFTRKYRSEVPFAQSQGTDMKTWNSARVYSYKEIKSATNRFKEVIGRGSFGSVYLGKLPDGKLVAVKVRSDRSQLGADSFINEVHLLSRIRHQNLVCLEGFCYESKQQILVYEYLSGGSLADHLYGSKSKKVSLSWVRRLKIAVDAAKGLEYLHIGSDLRIIHRDVKCSNILLDKDMNARVCDFGLSKQLVQSDASHVTTIVKGTAGYLDPEYYSTQQLTEKSDIYSFGVVLLELICGREPLRHTGTPDSFNLVLWAKPYLQAGTLEIVDEKVKESFDVESMRK